MLEFGIKREKNPNQAPIEVQARRPALDISGVEFEELAYGYKDFHTK
jgi:hypothetical protein